MATSQAPKTVTETPKIAPKAPETATKTLETNTKTEKYVYLPFNHKPGKLQVSDTPRGNLPHHTCIHWRRPDRLIWPQDKDQVVPRLQKDGAVVVKVFDDAAAAEMRNGIFTSFSQHFGLAENPKEWYNDRKNMPAGFSGVYQQYGVAHFPTMWNLRTDEKMRDLFETVYGEGVLVPSMDGFKINLPHEVQKGGKAPDFHNSTVHVDSPLVTAESPVRTYQGMVNLARQDPTSGGLFFGLGSHKVHFRDAEFTSGWLRYLEPAKFPVPIVAWYLSPGDVVIFDASLVHGTQLGLPTIKRPAPGETTDEVRRASRVAAYVTYMPARLDREYGNPDKTWAARNKAINEGRNTMHHALSLQAIPVGDGKPPAPCLPIKIANLKPRFGRKIITDDARLSAESIRNHCAEKGCPYFTSQAEAKVALEQAEVQTHASAEGGSGESSSLTSAKTESPQNGTKDASQSSASVGGAEQKKKSVGGKRSAQEQLQAISDLPKGCKLQRKR